MFLFFVVTCHRSPKNKNQAKRPEYFFFFFFFERERERERESLSFGTWRRLASAIEREREEIRREKGDAGGTERFVEKTQQARKRLEVKNG